MSYLGYKPADQDKAVIDWGGLTKQISDDLLAEKQRRDDSKVFLEQEHAKQLQKINEYEQGLDPQANTWMMEQIQSARNFMMENHRLMKRGIRGVNDKRLVDQNVMNTYTDLNNALKNYNTKIEELSKLPGKANEALIDEMANFAQLRNRKIYNDPNSGSGYLADVDPSTGEINEKTLMPVRAINGMQQQSFDVINVTDEVNKAVDKMGTFKVAVNSLETLENTRKMPSYKQFVDDTITSMISNKDKMLSVALDYLDIDYTKDVDDAKNTAGAGTISYDVISGYDDQGLPIMESKEIPIGKILMKNGPDGKLVPDFTPAQEELVKESLRNAIDTKFAFETTKELYKPTLADEKRRTDRQNKINTYNTLEQFFGGSEAAGNAIAQQFGMDSAPIIEGDKMIYTIGGQEYTSDATGGVKDAVATFVGGLANATGRKFGMGVEDYKNWSTNTNIVPEDFGSIATSVRPVTKVESYITPSNIETVQGALKTTFIDKDGITTEIGLAPDLEALTKLGDDDKRKLSKDAAQRAQLRRNTVESLRQLGAGKYDISEPGGDAIGIKRKGAPESEIKYVTIIQMEEDPEIPLRIMQELVRKPSSGGAARFN